MGVGVAALSVVKILMPFLSSISSSGMPMGGFYQGNKWVSEIRTGDSYIPDMGALGDLAGPGGYRGGSSDCGPGWITTLAMLAPVALKLMSRGKPCDSERI